MYISPLWIIEGVGALARLHFDVVGDVAAFEADVRRALDAVAFLGERDGE
jgi:hypothetical protein